MIAKIRNKELWDGWFVEGDIGQTIRNLLTTADKGYVLGLNPESFAYQVEKEIWFLGTHCGTAVAEYIKSHKNELFTWFVLQCANEGNVDG